MVLLSQSGLSSCLVHARPAGLFIALHNGQTLSCFVAMSAAMPSYSPDRCAADFGATPLRSRIQDVSSDTCPPTSTCWRRVIHILWRCAGRTGLPITATSHSRRTSSRSSSTRMTVRFLHTLCHRHRHARAIGECRELTRQSMMCFGVVRIWRPC